MSENNTLTKIDKLDLLNLDTYISQMQKLESFADTIILSKAFTTLQKKEDVVSCVLLALELGIPPMTALQLGTKLNGNAALSIQKGRELGLDWLTAIENVHVIPTKNGMITTLGVHIITSIINQMGITYKIIGNNIPLYNYIATDGSAVTEKDIILNPDRYHIVSRTTAENVEEMKRMKEEKETLGIMIVMKTNTVSDYGSFVEFTKEGNKHRFGYTYSDAIQAGLYDPKNKALSKDNWWNHPGTMCLNRTFSIAGRILASEKLKRSYLSDEINDTKIVKEIENDILNTDMLTNVINNSAITDAEVIES